MTSDGYDHARTEIASVGRWEQSLDFVAQSPKEVYALPDFLRTSWHTVSAMPANPAVRAEVAPSGENLGTSSRVARPIVDYGFEVLCMCDCLDVAC